MISVEKALGMILGNIRTLEGEEKPILECMGQVLDEDVYSTIDVPPADNAAMDGYAVRSEDTLSATTMAPVYLQVLGEVSAGTIAKKTVATGTAYRIMTGASMPPGADAVVRFEDTDESSRSGKLLSQIGILCRVPPRRDVRRAGEDIRHGELVLRTGTVLRPQEIGVLASLGKASVRVIRRPVVAILATGDELVDIGQPLAEGRIYNSNSYSIACQVTRYGGIPKMLGITPDRVDRIKKKLKEARGADLLITSGGVSMGDYDLVKEILEERGQMSFWTVRMKPGKPLAFGIIEGIPHLGLPGNPVSSMITFELFARPAILAMMGKKNLEKPSVTAVLEERVENTDSRRVFARATVKKEGDRYIARLTGPQGSGILTSMARANALVVVPEDVAVVESGQEVKALMLNWSEE